MTDPKLQVFEPAMCCETGVCGPEVDPALVRFARDVEWLRAQGVEVERFNLAAQPAAFAEHDTVRAVLAAEGNDCLPVVLADGQIVSRGVYPSRAELAGLAGLVGAEPGDDAAGDGLTGDPAGLPVGCGPGCDCHPAVAGGRTRKTVVSLLVLIAVVAILIYKGVSARNSATAALASEASAFATAQTAQVGGGRPDGQRAPDVSAKAAAQVSRLGSNLKSLKDLNEVARDQDAVFILIPGAKDEAVSSSTQAAASAAGKALEGKRIRLGLYTLATDAPEYDAITKQVKAPALVVAAKGGGMTAVSGEVTETKLLQAYVSSSNAGGCSSGSSCGPSGSCN